MTERLQPGWRVGYSLPMELDMMLSLVGDYLPAHHFAPDVAHFLEQLPAHWREAWPTFFGETPWLLSLLGYLAELVGVLAEADYSRATLAMRDLTLEGALAIVAARAAPLGIAPDETLVPVERLITLEVAQHLTLYRTVGFQRLSQGRLAGHLEENIRRAARVMRGGDLHSHFWHWLDRFFYEHYGPWRATQAEGLAALARHAVAQLGADERSGEPPPLDWLSDKNPLHTNPQLAEAVQAGRLRLFFWVEPLGLFDLWRLEPGCLYVSFAEPGRLYETFRAHGEAIAAQVKALSDPTRLALLRMIRHFSLDNTTLADYLDVSRPTISVHAKILREAGLIRSHQEGRQVYHEIIPEALWQLFHDLEQYLDLPAMPE